MLKRRLITAAVLIPLVVWGVLALPTPWFAICAGLVVMLGAWEWLGLVPVAAPGARAALLATMATALLGGWWLQSRSGLEWVLLAPALLWWLLALGWVLMPGAGQGRRGLKVAVAFVVLVPAWFALVLLHGRGVEGPQLVLFVLVLVWVADSGAFAAGKCFGRHKLAPRVSPGKTWEGVAGAAALSAAYIGLAGGYFDWWGFAPARFMIIALVAMLISIVGDLFISVLKRQRGMKDTSHLIPGHGGVLDRIDSLLAAGPVFAAGLQYL